MKRPMKKPTIIMQAAAAVTPIYFVASFFYKPELLNPVIQYTKLQTIGLPAVLTIVGCVCIYKWIRWETKGKKEQNTVTVVEPPPMSGEPISNEKIEQASDGSDLLSELENEVKRN